jgi:hypothetical protein
VIDAVRCAKLGLDHGLKGALAAPSSYFKKSPPWQFPDEMARSLTEQYIRDPKSDIALKERLRKAGVAPARYVTGGAAKATRASRMVDAAKPEAKRVAGSVALRRTAVKPAAAKRARKKK